MSPLSAAPDVLSHFPAWGRLPRVLTRYGINTVGDIADTPLATRSATQAGSGRGLPPAKPAAP